MTFLLDLAIVTISCLVLGLVSKHLRQTAIPVYIIAGIVLGKSGFDLITSYDFVEWLGKIGVIFLLFYIGHEFHYKGLKEHGRLLAGCTDFIVNFFAGFSLGLLIGLTLIEAFILASAVYISSSAIVITTLIENKRLIRLEAETVVWLMVFEDIILVILLVVLTSIMVGNSSAIPISLATALLLVVLLLAIIGRLSNFISPLFERDDEIPILLTFALIFGFSAIAHHLGVSVELVAFFLGSALSGVESFKRPFGAIITFKDLFLTIFFFFSFGMMLPIELSGLPSTNFVIVLLTLITLSILGKFVSGAIIGKCVHDSLEKGLIIGAYTMPRGEFSIVLLAVAIGTGVSVSELLSSLIIAYVIILSLIGSSIARYGDKIGKAMAGG
jgi:Kef-type K+ transport systems, membrane components